MDRSVLEMAAGLGAMFQSSSSSSRPLGPPSVCSHWIMADGDLNRFLNGNPSHPVVQALDGQPYASWQQAFVPSEGNRWWGRKRVTQHLWQYYNCETTMPQNGANAAFNTISRPGASRMGPVWPVGTPSARLQASRRYRLP